MKKLIIFTKLYPYAKTEAFLESEILLLSKQFEKIIIFPALEDKYIRELPSNVSVNKSFIISKKQRIFSLLIALINGVFLKYLLTHILKINAVKDLKNIVRYATYKVYFIRLYKTSKLDFNDSILYSYWFGHFVNSLQEIKVKFNINADIITRAHRWDIYEEDHGLFPYRQKSINTLKMLYSISSDGKKYLEERYGNHHKIKIARLGVYDKGKMSKPTGKKSLTVVSVSQITHRKRIFLLLDSLVKYASENSSISLEWIHFGTGVEMEDLKFKVKKISLENLKIDLRGYVLNTEIYTFYKTQPIDVFINLSESEGVPVSIMEAQSFGIPVIATNVGGTGEIVNHEVGVLLKDNPTIQEVGEAIDTVVKKEFNRKFIKDSWNKTSNAETNYLEFTTALINL